MELLFVIVACASLLCAVTAVLQQPVHPCFAEVGHRDQPFDGSVHGQTL